MPQQIPPRGADSTYSPQVLEWVKEAGFTYLDRNQEMFPSEFNVWIARMVTFMNLATAPIKAELKEVKRINANIYKERGRAAELRKMNIELSEDVAALKRESEGHHTIVRIYQDKIDRLEAKIATLDKGPVT